MACPSSHTVGGVRFIKNSNFKVDLLYTSHMALSCCMNSNDIGKNALLISIIYSDLFIFPLAKWLCCKKKLLKPFL